MKRKQWGIGLLSVILCAGLLSGCETGPAQSAPSEAEPTGTGQTTQASGTQETVYQYNVLTGLNDIPEGAPTRFVGVMIGNNDASRPQYGLEQADVYIEGETEGGITRIMAVFGSTARMPDTLGPVRSARTPFVKLAQALDLVYCHAGGSVTALELLREIDIADINAMAYEGSVFWRNSALIESKGYEYSMMIGSSTLQKKLDELGWRSQSQHGAPFIFGERRGASGGSGIQADITSWQTVSFDYDASAGAYVKYNGSFDDRELHTTQSGTAITVSNVIVIYAPKWMENELTCNFDLSEGRGIVLSGGTSRYLRYACSSEGLSMTEEDGTPLELARGKSYICIIDSDRMGSTVLR